MEQVEVPPRARELAGLGRVDYADAFAVGVDGAHPPRTWLELAEATTPWLFGFARAAHRVLGLRVVGASPDRPLGWEVLRRTDDEEVLGNHGTLGTARLVASSTPDRLVLSTLIRHDSALGRALWVVAAPVHRRVARYALGTLGRPAVR